MSISMSQLASKFAAASKEVTPAVERNLNRLAQVGVGLVKSEIQGFHAVDTATMLNSTTAERTGPREFLIGPTTLYAPFVALGTSRMAARPFHITAARKLQEQASEVLKAEDIGL